MKDGARLDSQLIQVDSLFRLLASGQSLILIAQSTTNAHTREETLEFAQHAYQSVTRLLPKAPVTSSERQRAEDGLADLKRTIDQVRARN